jgi:hypothetical protein
VLPAVTLAGNLTSIAGTVLSDAGTPGDSADDVPLEGVTVTATPQGGGSPVVTATAADGTYLLDALPPGTWDLTFTLTGFADGAASGVVSTAAGATADVTLAQNP